MVYKRKRVSGKRIRGRVAKRRTMNISRPRRSYKLGPVLQVKRTTYFGVWQIGSATTNDFWKYETFTAQSINNFTEFKNVFDEYKVNAIKVTYRPRVDNYAAASEVAGGGVAGSTGTPLCTMHTLVDPSSTLAPSGTASMVTLNTYLENQGIRTRTLNKPVSVYYRPKCSDQLYGGSTTGRSVKGGWIKTFDDTVQYRGYHSFVSWPNFGTINTFTLPALDVFVTFYVSFRNLK